LVAAGVAAGATSTRGPTFFVGNEEAAYDAALVEAFERAKAKAGMLAAAAGATLGPAITITEGGAVTPFHATGVAEGETKCAVPQGSTGVSRASSHASTCATPPPVKPGKSTVTATVGATFALQ
jgi:uncharacterized protein YggE